MKDYDNRDLAIMLAMREAEIEVLRRRIEQLEMERFLERVQLQEQVSS